MYIIKLNEPHQNEQDHCLHKNNKSESPTSNLAEARDKKPKHVLVEERQAEA